ncbi:ATP-dependent DNA ligase [Hygrophoropsis aurantiaca]|uniref:ATP-dependent DNA ligase n=1 Tax=Hygrophoropsis aurantiaca TaxID=72124 RepID=A0ACB8A8N1_9AGAM|nr:ATP-dependent DNA ligase [Hygrophoropsis aurantiaca]
MAKRNSSVPSTPKQKRARTETGQAILDSFFGKHKAVQPLSNDDKGKEKSKVEDVDDEAYARLIAQQESHGLLNLSHQESQRRRARSRAGSPEIIDVDADVVDVSRPSFNADPGPSSRKSSRNEKAPQVKTPGKASVAARTFGSLMPIEPTASIGYESLSVDPLAFSFDKKPWTGDNTPAPYAFLAHALVTLCETRSRIAIINTLTNTLRTLLRYHIPSLAPALYLLSNSLSPPYYPIELGIGGSIISKAIQHVSGLSSTALKRLYNSCGDVGDVAFEAKSNVRTLVPHPPLLISGVFKSLLDIAHAKGQGATKQKQGIVEKLLVAAKGEEARFLVRTLSMNLRVGAVRTSILTALARAMVLTRPSSLLVSESDDSPYFAGPRLVTSVKPDSNEKKKIHDPSRDEILKKFANAEVLVKKVFVQHPNYDHIVAGLLECGLERLPERVPLTVGIPLLPTLGSPTRSLNEIYELLGDLPFTAEFKYDGQRAQIHAWRLENESVSVRNFSRHLENMTEKYPDVVLLVEHLFKRSPELQSFIIDSEIVAIDPNDGSMRSFQELSNRARKDVKIQDVKVSVCVYAFDLMYLNGEVLLAYPFRQRRALLRSHFAPMVSENTGAARLHHVESCESETGRDSIDEFWMRAVESRCEGLMIKLLDSGDVQEASRSEKDKNRRKPLPATYEPDKRTCAWLKLKKDYVMGIGDSLDLVPVGAWFGNGRKAGWWSPILLAVRNSSDGKLAAVCKCMSGFSDAFYKEITAKYAADSENCSKQPRWECITGGFKPDVYFRPHEVWEIRGADITLSPVSSAALGLISSARGLSLRFPRFIKVREDKKLEDASTSEFLAGLHVNQQSKGEKMAEQDGDDLVDMDMEEEHIKEDSDDSDA